MIDVCVNSEIGDLESVLLHSPGIEIERMTPENAHHALYSDILNKSLIDKEYECFEGVLSQYATTYQITDLLQKILLDEKIRENIINESCRFEKCTFLEEELMLLSAPELTSVLIEGYPFQKGKHPEKYEKERYILKPLYNLFYTRDTSTSIFNQVVINPMAFKVRERERFILRNIFEHFFKASIISPNSFPLDAKTEGGDILIAREDLLCIGYGNRTNMEGILFLIDYFKQKKKKFTIITQQLPKKPDSFIHLDMVFTFLDKDRCMIYEPLIMKKAGFESYKTNTITIDNGQVSFNENMNLISALSEMGIILDPIACGGQDTWNQAREQWHSGANFFALGEGKIIGYARNNFTIDALDHAGFSVLNAEDICSGRVNMKNYNKFVVTVQAGELPRGGGGARCMTMPIRRKKVNW